MEARLLIIVARWTLDDDLLIHVDIAERRVVEGSSLRPAVDGAGYVEPGCGACGGDEGANQAGGQVVAAGGKGISEW